MVTLSDWYVQNTHRGFICNNCGKLFNKSDTERYVVAQYPQKVCIKALSALFVVNGSTSRVPIDSGFRRLVCLE